MAKAYRYEFKVDGRAYIVYAESRLAAEEQIRFDEGDEANVTFVERKPF